VYVTKLYHRKCLLGKERKYLVENQISVAHPQLNTMPRALGLPGTLVICGIFIVEEHSGYWMVQ
jgi:hypothetical protein